MKVTSDASFGETSDASFGDVAAGAFYGAAGDGFDPSELTRGPWDRASQHAGPPAALLGREVEQCGGIGDGPADRHVGRITFEVLASVPIAPLRVRASVERGGRRVDMVEAVLTDAAGVPLMRARAWRLLRREVDLPEGLDSLAPASPARRAGRPGGTTGQPPPPGDIPRSSSYFPTDDVVGYHSAMEYRFARSTFTENGPATTWLRALHPLVEGEVITPLQRVLLAADSGNGISSTLDFHRYLFVNVDLSVHLSRMPAGEWVCLDSVTVPEPTGVGLTDTMLFDELGPIGRAAQTLMIAER